MEYIRKLDLIQPLKESSVLLLGPRGTGKTSFLKTNYPEAYYVDLLAGEVFRELSIRPEVLARTIPKDCRMVIIDEVQKLPALLDEVQRLIHLDTEIRFILTGSSARKLRRQGTNLLGGRALLATMHSLTTAEIGVTRYEELLLKGGLPRVLDSATPFDLLNSYVGLYLTEEIQAEGAVRGIDSFGRFLETAARCSGEVLNFTKIGNDAGVHPRTIMNYFSILEDTLIGSLLPAYRKSTSRKAISTAKFYFFDTGVTNSLRKEEHLTRHSSHYGRLLEHLVFMELKAFLAYSRVRESFCFWRSAGKLEVDFVIGDIVAIEVKATERLAPRDFKGLRALSEDISFRRRIVVCHERNAWKSDDGIEVLPVEIFFEQLWSGTITKES